MSARTRHLSRTVIVAWTAGALQVASTVAAAQPPDPPVGTSARADAVLLFRQGRALLEAKDYAGAAAKFEESVRLDPGGGTQLNLALAYELAGKTASAWAAFHEALDMARRDQRADRIREAQVRIGLLEARLSRMRIVVPESVRVSGLELRRDGVALGEGEWNADAPLDPGAHRVEATAPDKMPWAATITLGSDADRQYLVVGPLVDQARPLDTLDPRGAGAPARTASAVAVSPFEGVARSSARRGAGGYVALAAAGVLAGAGVVAWRVGEDNASIYNDDNRCLVGTQTRAQQCGAYGRATDLASGVEIGAFAAAGVSAAFGAWLLWGPPSGRRHDARTPCFPSAGQIIVCGGTF